MRVDTALVDGEFSTINHGLFGAVVVATPSKTVIFPAVLSDFATAEITRSSEIILNFSGISLV